MSSTAVLETPFSSESPEQAIEVCIGTALVSYVKTRQAEWSEKDRRIAIACVKDLAKGRTSDASRRHSDDRRVRLLHLNLTKSDLVLCLHMAAMTWDRPTLKAFTDQFAELEAE